MNPIFMTIAGTGFMVAFFHAAIPTHWLPFVMAGRAQRWTTLKTLTVTAVAGGGHVLMTTILGVLIVWLGISIDRKVGDLFPWLAGGALVAFGLFYVWRQWRGHGHMHMVTGGHPHASHHHDHDDSHAHSHGHDHDAHHEHALGQLHDHACEHSHEYHAGDAHAQSHSHGGSHAWAGGSVEQTDVAAGRHPVSGKPASDWVAIGSLLALLTFSPCEGFLPVYLSGIRYGWLGFALLSAILAGATLAGMVLFTWITLLGLAKLKLALVERYESGILGGLLCVLGILVIVLEH